MSGSLVYHYTDVHGLMSIARNKKLWMTDIRYLNDREEGKNYSKYLRKLFDDKESLVSQLKEVVDGGDYSKYIDGMSPDEVIDLLLTFVNMVDGVDTDHTAYSLSFSKEGDKLSQWRGYCPVEGGFSLGFDLSVLKSNSDISDYTGEKLQNFHFFEFMDCIYNEEQKYDLFDGLFQSVLIEFLDAIKEPVSGSGIMENVTNKYANLINHKLRCKHGAFNEEEELRSVVHVRNGSHTPFFRGKGNLLIPYLELGFDPCALKEIKIGPCRDPDLTELSIKRFFSTLKDDYKEIDIEPIQSPYRLI